MKLKKLNKFVALMLTFVLMVATFAGCGDAEKSNDDKKSSENAGTFAETMMKAYEMDKCSYNVDIDFSVSADEVEEMISSSDATKEIFSKLGISGDTIKGTLSLAGKTNGTDASSVVVSVKFGNISDEVTEVIYVDEKVYLNVDKIAAFMKNVAKQFGAGDQIEQVLSKLPDGDYVEIPVDTIIDLVYYEEEVDAIKNIDKESLKPMAKYFFEEIEKIAKKAGGYSDGNGYTLTINKGNLYNWVKSGIEVVMEDLDTIYEKAVEVFGTELSDELSKEDVEEAKQSYKEITEDKWKELEDEIKGEFEEVSDMSISFSASDEDNGLSCETKLSVAVDNVEVKLGVACTLTKESDVSISAPDSVISEKDMEELMSLMGID